MEVFAWILLGWVGLVFVLWMFGLVVALRIRGDKQIRIQTQPDRAPSDSDPSVTILVAAHNEEASIEDCIRDLLKQNYGNLRVMIVNDRSTDATSDRARAVMSGDLRVKLTEIDNLPSGWIGKTHALHVAVSTVEAEYLLFVDCDCRLMPGALAAVMDKVVRDRLEFLTLWPWLELKGVWERLLSPASLWFLGMWALLDGWGRRSSEMRVGSGQFLLMEREAYRRLGGHGAVSAELAEDARFACMADEQGLRRWSGYGTGLYFSTRHNRLTTAFNALTRVFIGTLVSPVKMLLSPFLLAGGFAAPLVICPLGIYVAIVGGSVVGWVVVALAVAAYLMMIVAMRRLLRDFIRAGACVAFFPIGTVLCMLAVLRAFLVMIGLGKVRWGATRYSVKGSCVVEADSGQRESAVSGAA